MGRNCQLDSTQSCGLLKENQTYPSSVVYSRFSPRRTMRLTSRWRATQKGSKHGTMPQPHSVAQRHLARLTASATKHGIPSAVSEKVSVVSGKMKGHYIRTLGKVIDEADIVLLMLDAHDPTAASWSRSRCSTRLEFAEGPSHHDPETPFPSMFPDPSDWRPRRGMSAKPFKFRGVVSGSKSSSSSSSVVAISSPLVINIARPFRVIIDPMAIIGRYDHIEPRKQSCMRACATRLNPGWEKRACSTRAVTNRESGHTDDYFLIYLDHGGAPPKARRWWRGGDWVQR
ncbi:hypothetical protein EDB86DRAFT_2832552 [Lactarius hatsudake]|nr:hypothetical protein EDB86DRAFT_2832552 [Lactarius hatsudake]